MKEWTLVQHMHTRHSFDSLTEPRMLVERAEELGIAVISVTDHGTWKGSVEARECARDAGLKLQVIQAAEYLTDQGDVIAMFIDREYEETSAVALCDAIHARGGLTLLPHPYRWHKLDDPLLSRIDLIEVHNSRTAQPDNERAVELPASASYRGSRAPTRTASASSRWRATCSRATFPRTTRPSRTRCSTRRAASRPTPARRGTSG